MRGKIFCTKKKGRYFALTKLKGWKIIDLIRYRLVSSLKGNLKYSVYIFFTVTGLVCMWDRFSERRRVNEFNWWTKDNSGFYFCFYIEKIFFFFSYFLQPGYFPRAILFPDFFSAFLRFHLEMVFHPNEEVERIWRSESSKRFQNYSWKYFSSDL